MPPNVSFGALGSFDPRVIQKLISGVENAPPEARTCQNGATPITAMVLKARPMMPAPPTPSRKPEEVWLTNNQGCSGTWKLPIATVSRTRKPLALPPPP